LTSFVSQLNEIESNRTGQWKLDSSEMTSAVKFVGEGGVLGSSSVSPDRVADILSALLSGRESAVAGA